VKAPLRFGLVVLDQSWLEPELPRLDASGFSAVYVVDHPAFPLPDPWSWLAFAAGRTHRVRLGTHVTGAPFHHPTALARQVTTVDRLSGGRAVLGIGVGYEHADFEPYGFRMAPFDERLDQLDECLAILCSLWTREETRFEGRHHRLTGGARFDAGPVQQPHPPILIGLNREGRALDLAVERADGINTWQLSASQVGILAEHARAACEAAGRDPTGFQLTSDVLCAPGADAKSAEKLALAVRDAARSWGRARRVTDWSAGGVLHGDADAVAEQALRFQEAGVHELAVVLGGLDDLEWFDEQVIARIARAA
jgi:alkanesulfonate monooxygenase SsuD/methylene tetrahydromethanopterin reductase-like flavin-dependent oxidoreductase (luciferase family)